MLFYVFLLTNGTANLWFSGDVQLNPSYSKWTMKPFVLAMDQHYIIEHMRANLISPSDLHTSLLLSTRIRSFVFINSLVYRPRWSVMSNEILVACNTILFEIPFFFKSFFWISETLIEPREQEIIIDPE